ncbi:MAG TPA: DUF433 domain-containing protein [Isosphaeraceae bacterium]|nr:DUF433 domain-containing protein [Isosphaeraceae bacterium]
MKKDHYLPSSKFDDLDDYESDPCYKAFAKEMREDLAPTGALENFLAERVILTAWRLKLAQEDLGVEPDDSDKKLERIESRAERAMYKALAVLEKARSPKQRRWGKAAPDAAGTTSRTRAGSSRDETKTAAGTAKDDRPTASASDTWVSGKAKSPQTAPDGTPASTLPPAWRDRLVNDPTVSQESPVVKGTKLTVRQVVSLIVDGQSWDQILKDHPELSEDDVRACLAYAVEEENGSFKVE